MPGNIVIVIVISFFHHYLEHLPAIEAKTLVGKTAVDDDNFSLPVLKLVQDPGLQERYLPFPKTSGGYIVVQHVLNPSSVKKTQKLR